MFKTKVAPVLVVALLFISLGIQIGLLTNDFDLMGFFSAALTVWAIRVTWIHTHKRN